MIPHAERGDYFGINTAGMSGIFFHEYEMRSETPLNARSERRVFQGALLRIGDGFACLHPWPELGDLPLREQVACLREGESTPLIARAKRCADLDGLARRERRSLFHELPIPESHALVSGKDSVGKAVDAGFEVFKVKCGDETLREQDRVNEIARQLTGEAPRLRLDFNESLREESFEAFWWGLPEETRKKIEFVEDPFPYASASWERVARKCHVSLAVDRGTGAARGGYAYAVIKPAVDDVESALRRAVAAGCGVVFTSYMDHPVGQIYAAYEAAIVRKKEGERVGVCGLVTQGLFSPDAFLERVVSEGPRLRAPEGTGLGFDDLLESLPWKRLN